MRSYKKINMGKLFIYCFLFMLIMVFFYQLGTETTYTYNDLKTHTQWAQEAGIKNLFAPNNSLSYPLFHTAVYYLTRFFMFPFPVSAAFICSLSVLCSIAILDHYMRKYLTNTRFSAWFIFGISIGLTFFMALYIPLVSQSIYLGQFTGQPWHNPTYLVVKPFALLCFFLFYEFFQTDKDKDKDKNENIRITLFSLLMIISLLAKPSFIFVFGPAAALLTVFELIRSKFRIFPLFCKLVLAALPSLIVLLIQNNITLSEQGAGIIFAPFQVWGLFTPSLPFSLFRCYAFPLFVLLLLHRSLLSNRLLLFSAVTGLVGLLEFSLLGESGTRFAHANISWSLMCSSLILFAGCTVAFLQYVRNSASQGSLARIVPYPAKHWSSAVQATNSRIRVSGRSGEDKAVRWTKKGAIACGFVLLLLHFFSGFYYFYLLFNGGPV